MQIIVDTREPKKLKEKLMRTFEQEKINISFQTLAYGDYQIGPFLFERKDYMDFISSIMDGRLFKQILGLKEHGQSAIILEGKPDYRRIRISRDAVMGAMLSVSLDHGIPIIPTEGQTDTIRLLLRTAKRCQKDTTSYRVNTRKRPKSLKEEQQFLLESLPGVGPKLANEMLSHPLNIWEMLNIIDEIKVKGLGKKTKDRIKTVIF